MLTWAYEKVPREGTGFNATFNTQVEAQKKRFAGDAYQFLWSTPPLRLMFSSSLSPTCCKNLDTARTVGSVVRLVWHDHVSRRRFDMRPYANSFQILAPSNPVENQKKKKKTKAGTVGYGYGSGRVLVSVYLCARFVPVNVSDPLCVTCTVFCLPTHAYRVPQSHTHTQTYRVSHSPSHTFILFPRTYQCGLSWHKRIIKIPNYFFFKYANDTPPLLPPSLSLSLALSLSFFGKPLQLLWVWGKKAAQRNKTNSDAL